jgi:hypothetical protein
VRHRVKRGRGADGRGAGQRRQGRSPVVGWHEAKQEEALVSGGEAWDGGCSGVRSGGWHRVDRLGWRRWGREGGRCGLNMRVGDGGSGGHAGCAGSDKR